jgi:putative MATE family efflux protein
MNFIYKYFKDKNFIKTLYLLAVPIMLNELLNSAVNMLDTFMIGTLGDAPVAAVGLGNQVFFLFTVITFGINSGMAIFMGQYVGKNDIKSVHKTIGLSLIMTALVACLFGIAAFLIPGRIMSIYSKDAEVVSLGCDYLRLVAPSYILTGVVIVFNSTLKVNGNTVQPMLTTLIAFLANFAGNYIFIFKLGLGVRGSALSTLIARSVELLSQMAAMVLYKRSVLTSPKNYFNLSRDFCIRFVPVSLPVVCNETVWALGTTTYNIAYKYSGTIAQAAVQISTTVQNLFMVAGMAVGSACAIILSNTLGAGDKEKALDYSKRCIFFGMLMCAVMSLALLVARPLIVGMFKVDPIAKDYVYKMLAIVAFGILLKAANYISVCGILRSGGDTRFCLILEGCAIWFIGLPIAFIGSAILHLPIYVTFAAVLTEELVKLVLSYRRVATNRWLNTLV